MYIVIGAGLSGCVIAECITCVLKYEVLILEKRDYICKRLFTLWLVPIKREQQGSAWKHLAPQR